MELLSTVTVGSGGASEITFNNIPQSATNIFLLISGRINFEADSMQCYIHLNSTDTSTSAMRLNGNGSTTGVGAQGFIIRMNATSSTADTFSNTSVMIPNYTSSIRKSVSVDGVVENNATSSVQEIIAARPVTTSPVTSLQIVPTVGTLAQHSTASLYLITKA